VALRKSEEKYKSLANNLNVGVYRNIVGPEGKFIEANPAIVTMFGFDSREEFLRIEVRDLYKNPYDRKTFTAKLAKAGSVRNEELKLQKKDGTLFIGSVSAVAVEDEKGNIKYFDGIIEDITEKKQAETTLRESEEKYRTVLEANPDPVVVYDMEGKVIYFNPAFTDVFGWPLEERIGEKMDAFVPQDAWPETNMMIAKVQAGRRFSGIETFRYNQKGDIIPVSVSGAIYKDQDGNPRGSIINLRDISNQKKMEAQLQQSQKMEAIGTLAGGIAHDFNNILAGIFGYTQLLQMKMKKDSDHFRYLDSILKAGNRAKDLVEQILTVSRRSVNELNPMEIQLVVKEALKLLESTVPSTITIHQKIQNDCGMVMADYTQIHQIIMNLCTNAYHAMEESGGDLTVNLKEVELADENLKGQSTNSAKYIELTVSDTGTGIDPSIKDRIFDPYFTTKEEGKGTGLGLAVIHGIVKSNGGHIRVDSVPGHGTNLRVYLPVMEAVQEEVNSEGQPSINKGNERILLVDDQKDVIDIEQQLLEALGYKVTAKVSSIDALDTFCAHPDSFDLVITDMTMPNMTGDKLAGELNKIRSDIPVILCTGFSEKISEKEALTSRVKGFIMKPLVLDELAAIIRKVLDDK
jgi:PAS domain S-box-containing protein